MKRLFLMLFWGLLMLVVPVKSAGQNGELTKLNKVRIIVSDLDPEMKELGLSRYNIKNHVSVFLRGNLPRLEVNISSMPYVYINVNLAIRTTKTKTRTGHFGSVSVQVNRLVTINKTRKVHYATVWSKGLILSGPLGAAPAAVRENLALLLTKFATDWHQDNP